MSDKNGGAVKRCGGGHPVPNANGGANAVPPPKECIEIDYKIGVIDYKQKWEVEEPEAIKSNARTEAGYDCTLKVDHRQVHDAMSMYVNATCGMTIIDKQVHFMNSRLSGVW